MAEPAIRVSRSSSGTRQRLFPAFSLSIPHSLQQSSAIATQGGILTVRVRNNGLAPAFHVYVEAVRVDFRIEAPTGLFVWEVPAQGPGFWRRPRVAERLAPHHLVAPAVPVPGSSGVGASRRFTVDGPGRPPESLIARQPGTGQPLFDTDVLLRAAVPALAPERAADVALPLPALPAQGSPTGLSAWCLVLRAFDLLTRPAPDVLLPTPPQAPHRASLICLHSAGT